MHYLIIVKNAVFYDFSKESFRKNYPLRYS